MSAHCSQVHVKPSPEQMICCAMKEDSVPLKGWMSFKVCSLSCSGMQIGITNEGNGEIHKYVEIKQHIPQSPVDKRGNQKED